MNILLSLTVSSAMLAGQFSGQDLAREEQAILQLWERFDELFNRGDAEGVAGLYAPEADRTSSPGGSVAHGRAEIEDVYAAMIASRPPDWEPPTITTEIRFLRPDIAILDGVARTRSGQVSYAFTVILAKENDRWWLQAGRPRGSLPAEQ